jgi:hypothetical protein
VIMLDMYVPWHARSHMVDPSQGPSCASSLRFSEKKGFQQSF